MDIERDIEDRVRKISGHKASLSPSTELYRDLRIFGDDAYELLNGIARSYGTSFQNFRMSEFFPGESWTPWRYLRSLIGLPERSRRPFTLGHLIAVVKRGEWIDPTNDSG